MGSTHAPPLTAELLKEYGEAALANARELLSEADILERNQHFARTYFLAVSCIEETGKALMAIEWQSRNLADPAVRKRMKASMENHAGKTTYALFRWALRDSDREKALKAATDLVVHLNEGREPSMYTDLRTEPTGVQCPRDVVRPEAARDCVRLARRCLSEAEVVIAKGEPAEFTHAQDRLFLMKPAKFSSILSSADFWWYYISRFETGKEDIAEAVISYARETFN